MHLKSFTIIVNITGSASSDGVLVGNTFMSVSFQSTFHHDIPSIAIISGTDSDIQSAIANR